MFNEAHDYPPRDMDGIILGLYDRAGVYTVRAIVPAASGRSYSLPVKLIGATQPNTTNQNVRLNL